MKALYVVLFLLLPPLAASLTISLPNQDVQLPSKNNANQKLAANSPRVGITVALQAQTSSGSEPATIVSSISGSSSLAGSAPSVGSPGSLINTFSSSVRPGLLEATSSLSSDIGSLLAASAFGSVLSSATISTSTESSSFASALPSSSTPSALASANTSAPASSLLTSSSLASSGASQDSWVPSTFTFTFTSWAPSSSTATSEPFKVSGSPLESSSSTVSSISTVASSLASTTLGSSLSSDTIPTLEDTSSQAGSWASSAASSSPSSYAAWSSTILLFSSSSITSSITTPSSATLSTSSTSPLSSSFTISQTPRSNHSGPLFAAIATDPVASSLFPHASIALDFPSAIQSSISNANSATFQTNKFYTNLLLDGQNNTIWCYPYNLFFINSAQGTQKLGMGITTTNISERVIIYDHGASIPTTISNPTMVASLVLSAQELTQVSLLVNDTEQMSVTVLVSKSESSSDYIEMPAVQGMGMVTAIYHGSLTVTIGTAATFQNITKVGLTTGNDKAVKFVATLQSGIQWAIYAIFPSGEDSDFNLLLSNDKTSIAASKSVDGLILQCAVIDNYGDATSDEVAKVYDSAAGVYATSVELDGTVTGGIQYEYSFNYKTTATSGAESNLLVYLLPHHLLSLCSSTASAKTKLSLYSSTKGVMTGYQTNTVTFQETITDNVQFFPFAPEIFEANASTHTEVTFTSEEVANISSIIVKEMALINNDIKSLVTNQGTYTAGKTLDKYAYILLVAFDLVGNQTQTYEILSSLVDAFDVFSANKQLYPLSYIDGIGGIAITADSSEDYGNAFFNDHHFHYGYFVHAAAVLAKVTTEWTTKFGSWEGATDQSQWFPTHKDWVNTLVRDVANPSSVQDPYFPAFRMFDWFSGHSFASGLISSGDGRNQESSSEDVNFAYGMKLWGQVTGDLAMQDRGELMLRVMRRSMRCYYYFGGEPSSELSSSLANGTVIPGEYLPHYVPGILYENKLTYVTFFGTETQYIHGIHMIPMTAGTLATKPRLFAEQEWAAFQFDSVIEKNSLQSDPWGSVLKLNQALFDAGAALAHFGMDGFQVEKLDNGMSLTWSTVFAKFMSKLGV